MQFAAAPKSNKTLAFAPARDALKMLVNVSLSLGTHSRNAKFLTFVISCHLCMCPGRCIMSYDLQIIGLVIATAALSGCFALADKDADIIRSNATGDMSRAAIRTLPELQAVSK